MSECPVCFDDICVKTTVTMNPCGHQLCYQCVRDWNIHGNIVCPMCRAEALPRVDEETLVADQEPEHARKCEEQTNFIFFTAGLTCFFYTSLHLLGL